jgi:hypothetical protein
MSSRFHNKFHRHNHHTLPSTDPRYPDSAHDPIASPDSPFLGDFHLDGKLSAADFVLANIEFQNQYLDLPQPTTNKITTGEFLKVRVNNGVTIEDKYIRLWDIIPGT